jgi:hypothetical protein
MHFETEALLKLINGLLRIVTRDPGLLPGFPGSYPRDQRFPLQPLLAGAVPPGSLAAARLVLNGGSRKPFLQPPFTVFLASLAELLELTTRPSPQTPSDSSWCGVPAIHQTAGPSRAKWGEQKRGREKWKAGGSRTPPSGCLQLHVSRHAFQSSLRRLPCNGRADQVFISNFGGVPYKFLTPRFLILTFILQFLIKFTKCILNSDGKIYILK